MSALWVVLGVLGLWVVWLTISLLVVTKVLAEVTDEVRRLWDREDAVGRVEP